jgi:hypothetical protein
LVEIRFAVSKPTNFPAWPERTRIPLHLLYTEGAHAMNVAFLVAAVLIGADEKKKPLFASVDLDRGELASPVSPRVKRCARCVGDG